MFKQAITADEIKIDSIISLQIAKVIVTQYLMKTEAIS